MLIVVLVLVLRAVIWLYLSDIFSLILNACVADLIACLYMFYIHSLNTV